MGVYLGTLIDCPYLSRQYYIHFLHLFYSLLHGIVLLAAYQTEYQFLDPIDPYSSWITVYLFRELFPSSIEQTWRRISLEYALQAACSSSSSIASDPQLACFVSKCPYIIQLHAANRKRTPRSSLWEYPQKDVYN
jgi:hypothetical protein